MGRVTKIRARQTRANEKYTADDTSLATDGEVETRVRQHSSLFHHARNEVIKLYFTNGDLTNITTYDNDAEDNILIDTSFVYANGDLTEIEKVTFNSDGSEYLHLSKSFEYDVDGNLVKINNNKV